MRIYKAIILVSSIVFTTLSCTKDEQKSVPPETLAPVDLTKAADAGQEALTTQFWSTTQKYYNQNNDGQTSFNYWWHAHVLDVLVDGYLRTKDPKYVTQMRALVDGVYAKNGNTMKNTFYDDMEWMSIACLRAYDATKDDFYKTTALQLWNWIKVGWTSVNNGGIMWASGSPNSKNACSNAPAGIIAARLYQLDKNPDDLAWAKKIQLWMQTYLVEPARGLVYDGYGNSSEGAMYTYNQGTYVGMCLELYKITNDVAYQKEAIRNVNYLVNDQTKFSPGGILKGENTGDGGLFKGIFIRYMTRLAIEGNLDAYTQSAYLKYIKGNAESLARYGTKQPENVFAPDWKTKPTSKVSDSSVQLSGIMLLEAANELKKLNLIN